MQPATARRNARKVREGVVTSNRMAKTIVVRVSNLVRHPRYTRIIHQTSSFKVHDEKNSAVIGDRVEIMETRPISKEKRWRLVKILKRASTAPPVPEGNPLEATQPEAAVAPEAPATPEAAR